MANGFRSYADATDGAARPSPSHGGIDVWRLSVAEWSGRLPACRDLLSANETSRIDRLVFPRDRAVRAIARASLRCILARDLARHPTQVELVKTPHGKPVLARRAMHPGVQHQPLRRHCSARRVPGPARRRRRRGNCAGAGRPSAGEGVLLRPRGGPLGELAPARSGPGPSTGSGRARRPTSRGSAWA